MAKRTIGSNQYRSHTAEQTPPVPQTSDLMPPAAAPRRRCREMWGYKCERWVDPPMYSHGTHGLDGDVHQTLNSPQCPPEVLAELSHRGHDRKVVRHPNCPPETLVELLHLWSESDLIEYAVVHPNLPEPQIRRLAAETDPTIKIWVAQNPNCPPDVLAALANGDRQVRAEVARNPGCPPAVLDQLAHDHASTVVTNVAHNPSCPVSALRHIVHINNWEAHWGMVGLPQTPEDVLIQLLRHGDPSVAQQALAHPNLPEEYRTLGQITTTN